MEGMREVQVVFYDYDNSYGLLGNNAQTVQPTAAGELGAGHIETEKERRPRAIHAGPGSCIHIEWLRRSRASNTNKRSTATNRHQPPPTDVLTSGGSPMIRAGGTREVEYHLSLVVIFSARQITMRHLPQREGKSAVHT
jgi:hypothetical protein